MTVAEFKSKHGAAFKAFTRTACFTAFVHTLNDTHPLKKLKDRSEGEKLNGAALFLAQIDGYEECLGIINQIAADVPSPAPEPPSEYPDEQPS